MEAKQEKKTKKQLEFERVASSKFAQLEMFCKMCHFAKTNGAFGGNGITKKDLIAKGMSEEVYLWLVNNHYCNQQKAGKPLWIAINGNKLYPTQTVQNLETKLAAFKEQMLKKEQEKLNFQ